MFIGFNLAFLPMHLTGLLGMPRRVYTYADGMGWNTLNMITSIGSFVLAVGVLLFFVNIVKSLKSGAPAGANPWDAPTLEWSVPSPPPPYNFAVIPTVASRHPLWEGRLEESRVRSSIEHGMLLDEGKETIGTTALDAQPDMILEMPEDSLAPLFLAIGTSLIFVGLLLKLWSLAGAGAVVAIVALVVWLWPRRELREREPEPQARERRPPMAEAATQIAIAQPRDMPVGPIGRNGTRLLGHRDGDRQRGRAVRLSAVLLLLHGATRSARLASGAASHSEAGPAQHDLAAALERRGLVRRARDPRPAPGKALLGFGGAFVMGASSRSVQVYEWRTKPFSSGPPATPRCISSRPASTWRTSSSGLACSLRSSSGRRWITSARGAAWPSPQECSTGISWMSYGCSYSRLTTSPLTWDSAHEHTREFSTHNVRAPSRGA